MDKIIMLKEIAFGLMAMVLLVGSAEAISFMPMPVTGTISANTGRVSLLTVKITNIDTGETTETRTSSMGLYLVEWANSALGARNGDEFVIEVVECAQGCFKSVIWEDTSMPLEVNINVDLTCPTDNTPYANCNTCCPEDTSPYEECDSCCEVCPDCPDCPICPICPPEANLENCKQFILQYPLADLVAAIIVVGGFLSVVGYKKGKKGAISLKK